MRASDNSASALGSPAEMVLRAAAPGPARAAAASGASSDDPYGCENSFLAGAVGPDDSNSGSGGRNSNARMSVVDASPAGEFGTAYDGGDARTGGLRSRFFGEPSRTSRESSGAGGYAGSGGADEASKASRGGIGAAAAIRRASQVPALCFAFVSQRKPKRARLPLCFWLATLLLRCLRRHTKRYTFASQYLFPPSTCLAADTVRHNNSRSTLPCICVSLSRSTVVNAASACRSSCCCVGGASDQLPGRQSRCRLCHGNGLASRLENFPAFTHSQIASQVNIP